MRLLALFMVLLGLLAVPARADDFRPGYLEWRETAPGTWTVTWKAPLLGGLATRSRPSIPSSCRASRTEHSFEAAAVVERYQVVCSAPLVGREVGLTGLESGFSDALLSVVPLKGAIQAARLTPLDPHLKLGAQFTRGEVWWTYLRLGVTHIIGGFDHLLFVIGLVLLVRGWRQICATVTAFTLAHSLTLAATTLGLLTVSRKPVEICIALSITLLAREILRRPDEPRTLARRAPALIAFTFGLLHGFGFAAALTELGLPEAEIPLSLLAFNVGVEIGQLTIVAATLSVLVLVAKLAPRAQVLVSHVTAYAIGAVSFAWLIQRTLA